MNRRSGEIFRFSVISCAILFMALCIFITQGFAASKSLKQKSFDSPGEAATAIVEAAKKQDRNAMLAIFGPTAKGMILTEDKAVDKDLFDRFIAAYEEKNRIDASSDNRAFLYVGNNEWPFPVPIVKKGNKWTFDTKQGKAEIIQRRVGRNELDTVESCLAYVDAQKDYVRMTGQKGYARKFLSDPGTRNGLYWETKDTEEPSPLGIFMARAKKEGLAPKSEKPVPYHGYYYKILTIQGKNAPGGAHNYIVDGKMTGGHALIAYPAEYGITGIMTFIVNQNGVVYQKNLGKNSAGNAEKIKSFDPDNSWKKVE
ncbi:MAG: DUF2950 domain-containing protein [Syntrophorhabdaceae bacterium]